MTGSQRAGAQGARGKAILRKRREAKERVAFATVVRSKWIELLRIVQHRAICKRIGQQIRILIDFRTQPVRQLVASKLTRESISLQQPVAEGQEVEFVAKQVDPTLEPLLLSVQSVEQSTVCEQKRENTRVLQSLSERCSELASLTCS